MSDDVKVGDRVYHRATGRAEFTVTATNGRHCTIVEDGTNYGEMSNIAKANLLRIDEPAPLLEKENVTYLGGPDEPVSVVTPPLPPPGAPVTVVSSEPGQVDASRWWETRIARQPAKVVNTLSEWTEQSALEQPAVGLASKYVRGHIDKVVADPWQAHLAAEARIAAEMQCKDYEYFHFKKTPEVDEWKRTHTGGPIEPGINGLGAISCRMVGSTGRRVR